MKGKKKMDLLKDNIKPIYFKYLSAAFGSSFISSVYGIVDMAMVGQYHGPDGSAAMSVIMPVFNIIYGLGLLTGIGGSVLYGLQKGKKNDNTHNQFFSAAVLTTAVIALVIWGLLFFFDSALLKMIGTPEDIFPLAKRYLIGIKSAVPFFMFTQVLAAFLRNDNAPGLATAAVLVGGIFNVFGDYFFIFTLNLGITGAGLATAMGAVITSLMLLSHFFTKKNTLRLTKISNPLSKAGKIVSTGFSTFFVDLAVGIMTIIFNRQITIYFDNNALAVFGVLINISMFVQCCAYSIGQASQPILSINFGAGYGKRIRETLKYGLMTAAVFGIFWVGLLAAIPNVLIKLFMKPNDTVLSIAPFIMRSYGLSFLLLPLNIYSAYYFQSIVRPAAAFWISVLRGVVISTALIMLLPMIAPNLIWFAMPITEVVIASAVIGLIVRYTKKL